MHHKNYLCLDVGSRRIGVAIASGGVKIARPLATVEVDGTEIETLCTYVTTHRIDTVVIGFPRNQAGEPTRQSDTVVIFADTLRDATGIAYELQDESLTSVIAEQQLEDEKKPYKRSDIDARAAVLILQDYLEAL